MNCLILNASSFNGVGRGFGCYRIAHFLREHDWQVEVVDFVTYWSLFDLQQLARQRITSDTKFIGFSQMFSTWDAKLEEFAAWIKTEYPDIVLISGSSSKPYYKTELIDYYVTGFGEHAMLTLLKYLFSNGSRPILELQKINKGYVLNANQHYPSYPMQSLMVKYEHRDFIMPNEWLSVEFSRGCMFACAFCNFPVLGVKGDYTRDAHDFYEQMMHAYDNWGTKNYTVADETFNDRTAKITKFADVVEKLPFDPWFGGFIRADLLINRPADREELARMNFFGHYYGIESFNHASAKMMGKGMPSEKIQQGLIDVNAYYAPYEKYRGTISVIAGLPYDTEQILNNTQAWLLNHWKNNAVKWYALHIPDNDKGQASKISDDMVKYGYEVLDTQRDLSEITVDHRTNPKLGPSVKWRNKNTELDIFDVTIMSEQFQSQCWENNMLEHWMCSAVEFDTDIDTRLNYKFENWWSAVNSYDRVNSYIKKKLNL